MPDDQFPTQDEPRTGTPPSNPADEKDTAAPTAPAEPITAQDQSQPPQASGSPGENRTEIGNALDLNSEFEDAECLLRYAAQAGIEVSAEIVNPILAARVRSGDKSADSPVIFNFLTAYAKLAAKLAPVTAETVRASNERIGSPVKSTVILAVATTLVVVLLSLFLFVTNSINQQITDGVVKANDLAATVGYHVGPSTIGNAADEKCGPAAQPPDPPIEIKSPLTQQGLIVEVQTFAASIRYIQTSALKLNRFIFSWEHDPLYTKDPEKPLDNATGIAPEDALQLPPSLLNNLRSAALCKIAVYQHVRNFAQNVNADATLIYGSLASYILPVLMAFLGALAFNIRDYTSRIKTRSYHPSYVNSSRIIVAIIAGAVISLFNTFTQGLNLPPLAVAFLVGYGVEIFFAFLDSLLVAFGAKKDLVTERR